MKKNLIIGALLITTAITSLVSFTNATKETEFEQVTTIESVVPAGLGRSRMVTISDQGEYQEVKMKNFFSAVGINFKNVRNNDKMITDKVSSMTAAGWELVNINTGVYGVEGKTGIFITRYLFKREK